MAAALEHEPGIYFGLSEKDYHADSALGSSSLRKLLVAPEDWQYEQDDSIPKKPVPESSAMIFGRAVHALVLEGLQAFESRFTRKPEFPEGCLITTDDLKEHCRKLGLKVSGTKAELAERIRTVDGLTPLEPEIMARFEREKGDKTILSEWDYDRILMAERHITQNVYHAEAFMGGHPEVSVFWSYKNVRVKARIDYLKPEECVDLKSTAPWYGDGIVDSWHRTVRVSRLDMQAAHYMQGRHVLAKYIADGKIFCLDGNNPTAEWLAKVAQHRNPKWLWIVYQSDGAPISQGFRPELNCWYMQRAGLDVARAIDNYKLHSAMNGKGPWVRQRDIISMTDEDFPGWWIDRPEVA